MRKDTSPWAKRTYENLIRAIPALRKSADESPKEHHARVEEAIAKRWTCAVSTLRSFKNGRRRPTLQTNSAFFDDLRKYGRVEFDRKGAVKRASLDGGPSIQEFFATTPASRDSVRDSVR